MKTNHEIASAMVEKSTKGTKIVSEENKTGTSFFEGKKRLCKILSTKKDLAVEINVDLPKEIENEFGLEKIAKPEAREKHLGTMKYLLRTSTIGNFNKLITEMLKSFKNENIGL